MTADGQTPLDGDGTPRLSVVMPVFNESGDIERLLEEIFRQEPPSGGFEVILADGGSTDGTRDIVRNFREGRAEVGSSLRMLDNPGRLSSAGRNVGAGAARGEFVLFLDGHCALPRSDYFRRVVEIFEESGADCLARPQFLDQLVEGSWATAIAAARHSWFGHSPGSDIYGCEPGPTDPRSAGAAYRRECWLDLGGYDERFDACEDVEFNHRVDEARLLSWAHPDLTVHYRPRGSIRGLYRQMQRYGRGRARLMGKHPSMRPWPLIGLSGAALLLILLLVLGRPGVAGSLLALGIGLWLAVATFEAFRVSPRPGLAPRTVAAFAAIYAGLLFGFWRGLIEAPAYRGAPDGVSVGTEL
jgi:succinoglycan biosynthesis protein ExoA